MMPQKNSESPEPFCAAGGKRDSPVPLQVLGEVFAVLTRRRRWDPDDARVVVTSLISALPTCSSPTDSLQPAMAYAALTPCHFGMRKS